MGERTKINKQIKRLQKWALPLGALAIVGGLLWWWLRPVDPITQLQQRGSNVPTLALANTALKPPTNKWFSSLAFKQPSEPVFAYPLALQTTAAGFAVSYPRVAASAHVVDATFAPDVGITVAGNDIKSFIREYDDLSVELEIRSGNTVRGTARITQGSPYIFMQLRRDTSLTVDTAAIAEGDGVITLQKNGRFYEMWRGEGVEFTSATRTIRATKDNAVLTLYVVPDQSDMAALRKAAQFPITGTEVRYTVKGNTAETTFTLNTKDNQPTMFGLLPSQTDGKTASGSTTTLLGTQKYQHGTQFTFATPLPDMPGQLPLDKLSADERAQLTAMLAHDATTLTFTAVDTYYAGKQLYRAAQLLQLANQLNLGAEANTIQAALKTELTQWFDPNTGNQRHDKYFYYDTTFKGVVGEKPSFGSQEFNDHHFHYGYFLVAAAVLAQYDTVFATEYESRVTMLARDIANTDRNDPYLPYLRTFDQYTGHSWASGTAPFGAGNNQESSSEAVNAWYGMYLWARSTGDTRMQQTAQWLYAREAQSALTYYLNIDKTRPELAGYTPTIVSLLWSGKADYATFFDAAPESKLAIQLLPVHPAAGYLAADPTRITQNLARMQAETGQSPSKFKDYIVMYKALVNPKAALAEAAAIGDAEIDNGNSRSYLYAWLFTRE